MKKQLLNTIIFIFISVVVSAQGTWTARSTLFQGIFATASFSIGNYGYIATGGTNIGNSVATIQYDPQSDVWTQVADAGVTGRSGGVGFSINGKGYVTCGEDDSELLLPDLLQYDPVANTWTNKAPIPQSRLVPSVFVVNNKAYISCGATDFINDVFTDDVSEYDPATDQWITKNVFPGFSRYAASGFSVGNTGYMVGGIDLANDTAFDELWQYNFSTDTWAMQAVFPGGQRGGMSAFSIGGYGYAGNGIDINMDNNTWWRYDPINNTWASISDFVGVPRDDGFSFVINGRAFAGGGVDDNVNPLPDLYEFNDSIVTSVNELFANDNNTFIYPNPSLFTAGVNIKTDLNLNNAVMSLYDLHGKLVFSSLINSNYISFQGNHIVPGNYLVTITEKGELIKSEKIILY